MKKISNKKRSEKKTKKVKECMVHLNNGIPLSYLKKSHHEIWRQMGGIEKNRPK